MRTPIAGIRAQAEAALVNAQPDDAQRALERIARATQIMGDLVQKLLVLARVDAAENTVQLSRLDGVEVVREVAREWVPEALSKGVGIGFETQAAAVWVMGDAQLLQEMLANLIDNALRYGGTRIMLSLASSEQGATWRVADNGPGIPESQRAAVFAPFHRLTGGVEGSGLGLTIVQRIAHLHGAVVSLGAGEDGRGLVACVKFPPIPACAPQ